MSDVAGRNFVSEFFIKVFLKTKAFASIFKHSLFRVFQSSLEVLLFLLFSMSL